MTSIHLKTFCFCDEHLTYSARALGSLYDLPLRLSLGAIIVIQHWVAGPDVPVLKGYMSTALLVRAFVTWDAS